MEKIAYILVFLGGGLGSMLRYSFDQNFNALSQMPLGTMLSNVLASLILGIITALLDKSAVHHHYGALIGIGFCGGFSTFSTFSKENSHLLMDGQYVQFCLYLILSISLSIMAFVLPYYWISKI